MLGKKSIVNIRLMMMDDENHVKVRYLSDDDGDEELEAVREKFMVYKGRSNRGYKNFNAHFANLLKNKVYERLKFMVYKERSKFMVLVMMR